MAVGGIRLTTGKPTTIEEYLARVPDDARATLEAVMTTIRSLAPEAAESISYDIPAFKYRARPLAYVGAWKNHCAMYGVNLDAHKEALAGYELAKGTLRFPIGKPLPEQLVRLLVAHRMAEIDATAKPSRSRARRD
jgi:uncharacterized protein YdhG (YjbR/CyaY superfamily)